MSLEQLLQKENPSFFQKIRSSLAGKLLPFVAASTFALAACGPSKKSSQCNNDYDCPSQQLCVNQVCSGGGCNNDYDCPGDQLCVDNICTVRTGCNYDADCPGEEICVDNICTYQEHPKTEPQEIFNEFVNALESGNLTEISKYFHPQSSQIYTSILSGNADLPQEVMGFSFGEDPYSLAQKLKGVNLTLEEEFSPLRDYSYPCADKSGGTWECLIRFKKDENGSWKIKNF